MLVCYLLLQIIAIGKKYEVKFYGDNSTASMWPGACRAFDSTVDVSKHIHKQGYEKAMKEALMDAAEIHGKQTKVKQATRRKTPSIQPRIEKSAGEMPTGVFTRSMAAKQSLNAAEPDNVRITRSMLRSKDSSHGGVCSAVIPLSTKRSAKRTK